MSYWKKWDEREERFLRTNYLKLGNKELFNPQNMLIFNENKQLREVIKC